MIDTRKRDGTDRVEEENRYGTGRAVAQVRLLRRRHDVRARSPVRDARTRRPNLFVCAQKIKKKNVPVRVFTRATIPSGGRVVHTF